MTTDTYHGWHIYHDPLPSCNGCKEGVIQLRVQCPTCKKWVSAQGLAEHQRAKHGAGQ